MQSLIARTSVNMCAPSYTHISLLQVAPAVAGGFTSMGQLSRGFYQMEKEPAVLHTGMDRTLDGTALPRCLQLVWATAVADIPAQYAFVAECRLRDIVSSAQSGPMSPDLCEEILCQVRRRV